MILEKLRLLILTKQNTVNFTDFLSVYLHLKSVVLKTVNGFKLKLRPNGIDYWLYIENLIDDTYGLNKLSFLKFDNIVDIGSNIGYFTVSTKKYWPKAKHVCLEPNPESYQLLIKNLKLNQIKASVINKAVVGKKSKKRLKLYTNENPAMSSLVTGKGKVVSVNTQSLESIIPHSGKTLVKVDIEGGEYDLINTNNKSVFKRIDVLLMETHNLSKLKSDKTIIRWLKSIGFKVYYENRNITAFNLAKATT